MIDETAIRSRYEAMRSGLDERERRLFAAAEAGTAGYGGVSAVARATGIARSTINRGLKDLIAFDLAQQKVRRAGGGRPSLTQTDPTLLEDLQRLLEPATLGDPMRRICRKFRVRAITMEKKETSYGETEATGYFRRAA